MAESRSKRDYRGVRQPPGYDSYEAVLKVHGQRHYLGRWSSARQAAIAWDRAALHLKLDTPLNLPKESHKRGGSSPLQLREESRRSRTASRYNGVVPQHGRYRVVVTSNGGQTYVGTWDDERQAAIARDRAVLHVGQSSKLNFPRVARNLGPASPEQLRQERGQQKREQARREGSRSSRYEGVSWSQEDQRWVVHHEGRAAMFLDELEAAKAYDQLTIGAWKRGQRKKRPRLNFPEGALPEATLLQVRAHARWLYKQQCSSVYRGVRLDRRKILWTAQIESDGQPYYLGTFSTQEDAARAYDQAALRLHGRQARLNFDPISGQAVHGLWPLWVLQQRGRTGGPLS